MEGTYGCGARKRRDAEDREIAEGIAQKSHGYERISHPALDYQELGNIYCVYLTRILVPLLIFTDHTPDTCSL